METHHLYEEISITIYHPKSVWMQKQEIPASTSSVPEFGPPPQTHRNFSKLQEVKKVQKKKFLDWCGTSHRLHQEDSR